MASTLSETYLDYPISSKDLNRPWGGFYCIDKSALDRFIQEYFPDLTTIQKDLPLSPKILIINPDQRLSWQYHLRRKEIWTVIKGPVGVVRSPDDTERLIAIAKTGDRIVLEVEERHRLVGLSTQAIVAELWQHTDPNNPSTEEDIIRVQDDFHRKSG